LLAIETVKLSRTFDNVSAVAELDLAVEQGEVFGFLGSNGAGKTTTIRMLTGQLQPTAGVAKVMGRVVVDKSTALAMLAGVVFELANLYPRLSARQNLAFAAELYDVPSQRIDELLEWMSLSDRAMDPVEVLSTGMKQKLCIARALLHRPRVLFLDEPTSGLDPSFARGIRDEIRTLKEEGTTVFLTTHYMEEAEELCDRVAFIERGRVLLEDSPASLKRNFGKSLVRIELKDGRAATLSLEDEADRLQLADWVTKGLLVTVHSQEASLEDIFVEVVGKR